MNAPNAIAAFDWLAMLYGEFDAGWLSLFAVDRTDGSRRVDWLPVADLDGVADRAARRAERCDVWLGVATRREKLKDGRGGDADCAALPGLWLDVDIAGPGHKGGHALPPDEAAAWSLIRDFPAPPSAVVHSGGGLQAWWLFDEPLDAADAVPLLIRWHATWSALGLRHGWHVDNVFDLARIMRLPGTLNRKLDEPRPVTVVEDTEARYGPSDLDEHLIDPAPPVAPPTPARVPLDDPELPGAVYNARTAGGDVLAASGWTLAKTDRNGDQHWTRPGKDPRQGSSATVYADDGHTTIYSDTVAGQFPSIELRRPYDPFGLYAHLQHGGDWTRASETLAGQGYGKRPEAAARVDLHALIGKPDPPEPPDAMDDDPDAAPGSSWRPTDIADLHAKMQRGEVERPAPTVGRFAVGNLALYYPGRVNGLYGESGLGKSWIAVALAAEVLGRPDPAEKGDPSNRVAWIDLEEPAEGILQRLDDLGVPAEAIRERFAHFAPEEPIRLGAAMFTALDEAPPGLVVIDSTGEALTLEGAGPNNDDEVATWFRSWPRRLAQRYGACVVVIDHVVKDEQTRGLFPGGSQRKRAAITGSAFMVDERGGQSLGKGAEGRLTLKCAKDRHGTFRRGQPAAEFVLNGAAEPQTWHIAAPSPPPTDEERLARIMRDVCGLVAQRTEAGGRTNYSNIEDAVTGKKADIKAAVEWLVEHEYLSVDKIGTGHYYHLERPYEGPNALCGVL